MMEKQIEKFSLLEDSPTIAVADTINPEMFKQICKNCKATFYGNVKCEICPTCYA